MSLQLEALEGSDGDRVQRCMTRLAILGLGQEDQSVFYVNLRPSKSDCSDCLMQEYILISSAAKRRGSETADFRYRRTA